MPTLVNPRLLGMAFEPPLIAGPQEDREWFFSAVEEADKRSQRLVLLLELEHLSQDARHRVAAARENGQKPARITFSDLRYHEWLKHAHHILLHVDDLVYRIK